MNEPRTVNASFDGACEPWNPGGHMGLGWVINGTEHCEYVESGPGNTNNVAEYRALIRLLEGMISEAEPGSLIITGDSDLVVNQVAGDWNCNGHLVELRRDVNRLIDRLKITGWIVSLGWVPRACNSAADSASKKALIEHGIEIAMREPEDGYTTRLGDIAKPLGISSVALGRILDKIEIRGDDGLPTRKAINDGYAQRRFNGHGLCTDWHVEKVTESVREHFRAIGFTPKPQREPVLAEHLCRHTVLLGLRPSHKLLETVKTTLCNQCLKGDTRLFKDEREHVLKRCLDGESLVDAVELSVTDPRLRPSVYMAAWGKWFHDKRAAILDNFRDSCEKPGLHPEYLAQCKELEMRKGKDLQRLIRFALQAE